MADLTAIALDGPLNGEYIDAALAEANDYELGPWGDELAYYHNSVPFAPAEDELGE